MLGHQEVMSVPTGRQVVQDEPAKIQNQEEVAKYRGDERISDRGIKSKV